MKRCLTVPTAWGRFIVVEENAAVIQIFLPGDKPEEEHSECCTALLDHVEKQLREYFCGKRRTFELPLNPAGTPFHRKVWQELCKIPYGEAATYGEIAVRIGMPGGARAVGQACHRNPIPILIPCHRVVAANRSPGGYGGGLELKLRLLDLEGIAL